MIYNMYIFDRHCQCIYYHDWHRGHTAKTAFDTHGDPLASHPSGGGGGGSTTTTTTMTDPRQGMNMSLEEEGKLVYGVVFSLRNLVKKLGKRYAFLSILLYIFGVALNALDVRDTLDCIGNLLKQDVSCLDTDVPELPKIIKGTG